MTTVTYTRVCLTIIRGRREGLNLGWWSGSGSSSYTEGQRQVETNHHILPTQTNTNTPWDIHLHQYDQHLQDKDQNDTCSALFDTYSAPNDIYPTPDDMYSAPNDLRSAPIKGTGNFHLDPRLLITNAGRNLALT